MYLIYYTFYNNNAINFSWVKPMTIYAEYTYEKLYLLKSVFFNFLNDHKSINPVKQLRYAEHYYEYSHEKIGQISENCSNGYNMKKHKIDLHTMI